MPAEQELAVRFRIKPFGLLTAGWDEADEFEAATAATLNVVPVQPEQHFDNFLSDVVNGVVS
jgi:hypothetical protein